MAAQRVELASQPGYLEPVGELPSPFTVAGMFGVAAPSPLVLGGAAEDNYMRMGGLDPAPVGYAQTVDAGPGPVNPLQHTPHASNLLKPMHSEGFWLLLLVLGVMGLFSVAANAKLGPVRFGGSIGN